jgi:hypothetical protein
MSVEFVVTPALLALGAGELALMIPLLALSIPIVSILVKPMTVRMKRAEREKARKMYQDIVMAKLDVMKTAITMGHSKSDLAELDERLERLVGADRMQHLLEDKPGVPVVKSDSELMNTDLLHEVEEQRRIMEKE